MSISEMILSGGFLALVGLIIKSYKDSDAKIARLYRRLDETKQNQEDRYTRKEVCAILHTQVHNDLVELKADVKLLLKHNGVK
jgi:hypothetical protein